MTSGVFGSVEIESILINRETRQRREFDPSKLEELAESMHTVGQIHPVVITRDKVLVTGERRLMAAKLLGWTDINFQFVDEVDPIQLKLIELEENVKRVDLTWQEQVLAIKEYHDIRKTDPDWSEPKTAKELSMSTSAVNKKLKVAEGLVSGDERIVNAPKLSVAIGVIDRAEIRKEASAKEIETLEKVIGEPLEKKQVIFEADFLEWAPGYSGPKFNFIHCDFPYGIGADSFNQGGAAAHGGYADTPETYWRLLDGLAKNIDRFLAPSAHIMFWYSLKYHNETLDFFRKNTDFKIDPFPLIWWRSNNAGILPDPKRGPRRVYETCLFGSRGDRQIVRAVSNLFPCESVRERHMSEKPERMLRNFFQMFCDENTLILDPTCGSGSSIRAAATMRASHLVGLEINPEFAKNAQQDFDAAQQNLL